jgi:hypothetical protein
LAIETTPDTRLAAEQLERLLRRPTPPPKPLPGWVGPVMRALPYLLITVTLVNLLIGLLAILTPLLAAWLGSTMADPLYGFYALLCPQRPSHTWHIASHPMGFEQRDVAMYVAFGITGLLYLVAPWLRQPLSGRGLVLGCAPLLIDVALSSFGVLPSTWFSRLWTGALASFVIVWWSYPRFDAYLSKVQAHVASMQGKLGSVRS